MPALVFLVSILYVPGLPSGATIPRWGLLFIVAPVLWYFASSTVTAAHAIGVLFLSWAAFSLLWTFNLYDGLQHLAQFVLLGLLFCIGASAVDMRKVYFAAGLGAAINSGFVIAQTFGSDIVSQLVPPAGLFLNKNIGAEFVALAAVAALVERRGWLVAGSIPTLILCHSRGSLIALGTAAIVMIYRKNKAVAVAVFAACTGGVVYVWNTTYTLEQRVQLWQDTAAGVTFWGRGIGSFWTTFPEHASRIDALASRANAAHNDMLQVLFELGVPGLCLLLAFIIVALRGPRNASYYVLVVFLVEGAVGFPLYMPATAMLAALACGHVCRDGFHLRSALDRGRRLDRVGLAFYRAATVRSAAGRAAVSARPQHSPDAVVLLHGGEAL